jgi:hypothetical protein
MKTTNLFTGFFLIILSGFFQSCINNDPKTENYSDDLSAESKSAITNEILDLTTNWANAHTSMDADKAIELWDSTADLMFAENGFFFANRDSIYSYLKGFYSSTQSMDLQWQKRVVIPLSLHAASMSGYFHFKAIFKDESIFEGNSMFTGVFVKKNNGWVLIHGHESVK